MGATGRNRLGAVRTTGNTRTASVAVRVAILTSGTAFGLFEHMTSAGRALPVVSLKQRPFARELTALPLLDDKHSSRPLFGRNPRCCDDSRRVRKLRGRLSCSLGYTWIRRTSIRGGSDAG